MGRDFWHETFSLAYPPYILAWPGPLATTPPSRLCSALLLLASAAQRLRISAFWRRWRHRPEPSDHSRYSHAYRHVDASALEHGERDCPGAGAEDESGPEARTDDHLRVFRPDTEQRPHADDQGQPDQRRAHRE